MAIELQIGADIRGAVNGLNQLDKSVKSTAGALKSVSGASNTATQSMTNLSRIVQDAPYGFIGIANNINPALEGFQRLQKETGSTGKALKALGSSLVGAGGLGLAVSVISSALVLFGDSLFSSASKTKDAKEALDEYVNSLNDVTRSQLKGSQSAQEELVKLDTLYKATQNANIPLADRKRLVDELQAQYPKYFANLSDEAILAGQGEKAYKGLSEAILASARARAAQDSLVEIQKQILVIEQQQVDIQSKLASQLERVNRARAAANQLGAFNPKGIASVDSRSLSAQNDLNSQTSKYNDLVSQSTSFLLQRNRLLDRARVLTGNITSITEDNVDSLLNPTGSIRKSAEKTAKDIYKELQDALSRLKPPAISLRDIPIVPPEFDARQGENFFRRIQEGMFSSSTAQGNIFQPAIDRAALLATYTEAFKEIGQKLPTQIPMGKVILPIDQATNLGELKKSLEELYKNAEAPIKAFAEKMNSLIQGSLANTASAFGEGLGQAIVSGDLGSAFKNVASVMGGFLQDLGRLLIQESIKIEVFKKAFAGILANPALAITAGVGLIAAGAAIRATLPSTPKFAQGGLVFGPTMGIVGEGRGTNRANPEVIAPLDKLQGFLQGAAVNKAPSERLVATVQGKDLALILQRYNGFAGRNV